MLLFSIHIGLCSPHHQNHIRDEMLSDPRSWDTFQGTDSWRCGHQGRAHIELRNHTACLDKGRFALHIKETISTTHVLSTYRITSLFRKPFTINSYVFRIMIKLLILYVYIIYILYIIYSYMHKYT